MVLLNVRSNSRTESGLSVGLLEVESLPVVFRALFALINANCVSVYQPLKDPLPIFCCLD